MLQGILPREQLALLRPETGSLVVLALVSEDAPTRAILCAGAGSFEIANITLTEGIHLAEDPPSAEDTPSALGGSLRIEAARRCRIKALSRKANAS